MEHFLERVSLSRYNDHFILKGGTLVASIVGVNMRATMDIDTTVKALPLNEEDIRRIISEICAIPIEDGVSFQITSVSNIMEDFEYPGIRLMLEAVLERMRQPIKIDISTNDVITPAAVEYNYKRGPSWFYHITKRRCLRKRYRQSLPEVLLIQDSEIFTMSMK